MSLFNVLIIEPNPVLGNIYKDFFTNAKFEVVLCNDGQKAIDAIDKAKPDFIILELQLTGHNGYEFLYELRSYKEWLSIPVLINTFIPESRTKLNSNNLHDLGIVGYLYKPTTSLEKIKNFIEDYALTTQT
ncbi:MAG TPA: response regulator [Candidatus Dormibacteraeota bacterium]|nr:response regulator [Candidatus Dormibacteraeota bacterium]